MNNTIDIWTKQLLRPHSVTLIIDGVRGEPVKIGVGPVSLPLNCSTGMHEIIAAGLDADGQELWRHVVTDGPFVIGQEFVFTPDVDITAMTNETPDRENLLTRVRKLIADVKNWSEWPDECDIGPVLLDVEQYLEQYLDQDDSADG